MKVETYRVTIFKPETLRISTHIDFNAKKGVDDVEAKAEETFHNWLAMKDRNENDYNFSFRKL